MKNKIVSLLTALGLSFNVASASNSASIGYASDFFYRGSQKAEESVKTSVMLSHSTELASLSAHVCSNQAISSGDDSYHMGFGASKSFADLLSVYVGFNHFEDVPGSSLSEVEMSFSLDKAFSPKLSVYRDLDESIYTVEGGVSYSIDSPIGSVQLDALAGNTELNEVSDLDYYVLGVSVSYDLSESSALGFSVDYVDPENTDEEFVVGTSLSFNF